MPKLPIISGQKTIKTFAKAGYYIVRQRSSHIRLHHPYKKPLTIPDHKTIGRGLLKKLLRDSEISIADFLKLLK